MALLSIYYDVPATLKREQELLEAKCNLLIEAFNGLAKDEKQRIEDKKKAIKDARQFNRSIETIETNWRILKRTAVEPSGDDDDTQWSRPFKIINGVLFHADFAYQSKSWNTLNALIPQGLFTEEQLDNLVF